MSFNFNKVVLLKNFASYFDRKIFFYRTLAQYKVNTSVGATYSYTEYPDINFNPNDGIDTTLVLNNVVGNDLTECNYLLVCDPSSDDAPVISRWYVMDAKRTTEDCYILTLRRDVVAEAIGEKSPVWEAPFFIERGMLDRTKYNPLLLNDEGMNLNQIKKEETLLFDGFKTPWIVAYFANNTTETTVQSGTRKTSGKYLTLAQVAQQTGIAQTSLETMLAGGTVPLAISDIKLTWAYSTHAQIRGIRRYESVFSNSLEEFNVNWYKEFAWQYPVAKYDEYDGSRFENQLFDAACQNVVDVYDENEITVFETMLTNLVGAQFVGEKFINLDMYNKLYNLYLERIRVLYQGRYYYLMPSRSGSSPHTEIEAIRGQDLVLDAMIEATDYVELESGATLETEEIYNDGKIFINYNYSNFAITLIPAEDPETSYNFQYKIPTSHNILDDGAYSMLAIPLNPIPVVTSRNPLTVKYTPSKDVIMQLAIQTALALSTNLIDIQILPYAPKMAHKNSGYYYGDQAFDITNLTLGEDYEEILDGDNNVVGYVIFETVASYSLTLDIGITPKYDTKEEANTTMYRLCSPNYSGAFEFNLAKVNSVVSKFCVDITYKPFNPFIRVTPEFDRLYGKNYKDGRGLICGGDFSLPVVNDQWKTYQNNNKMFAQIFSRDIQNLEFKQDIERFKEPFAVLSGTAVGAGAGAMAGGKYGGGYGALAGAAVGAAAGLAGGLIDVNLNERQRQEEKRYSFDRFNLSLANIKAMPQSLSKNSSLTEISKLVPFLEFYDCTPEEHAIFKDRIKYNGMSIGRIGNIGAYFAPVPEGQQELGRRDEFYFFKAQLIHAEDLEEDNHFLSVLYDEFAKGVYL